MTFTVLDAPSNLGLRPPAPGVEPGVRRLADACGPAGSSSASAPRRRRGRRAALRVGRRQPRGAPGYTRLLAARIGELLDAGERPLVLGGDCSILLGAMLALDAAGGTGSCTSTGTSTSGTPAGRAGWAPSPARTWRASPAGSSRRSRTSTGSAPTCSTPTPSTSASASVAARGGGDRADGDHRPRPRRPARARSGRPGGALLGPRRRRRARQRAPARGRLARAGRADVRGARRAAAHVARGPAAGVQVTVFDPDLDPADRGAERLLLASSARRSAR